MTRASIYRRSRSSNPAVAIPALVRLGALQEVGPTTDTGYKSYGPGRLMLPAGTNYATNPAYETDTNGDGLADGFGPMTGADAATPVVGTPTYSIVTNADGTKSQRVQYTFTTGDGAAVHLPIQATTAVGSFVNGDAAFLSTYVTAVSVTGCDAFLMITEANAAGTLLASTTPAPYITAPGRHSLSKAIGQATASRLVLFLKVINFAAGDSFDISLTKVSVEKSAVLTPFFSGPQTWDSMSDCAWTGTVNASTSTRGASVLYHPTPWATVPATGTLIARSIPLGANTAYASEGIAGLYATTTPAVELCHATGKHSMKVGAAATSAATFAIGATLCDVGRWDAAGTYLHHNGTAATDGAAPTVGGAIDRLYIGIGGKYYVGPVALTSTCLTAAQAVLADTLVRGGGTGLDLFRMLSDWGAADLHVYPLAGDSRAYRKAA